MRVCFFVFLLSSVNPALGQSDAGATRLYYFTSKGKLGVKDGTGRIVIPANNYNFSECKNGQPVKEALIQMMPVHDTSEPQSMGVVYNRKGELLYRPFAFDNGPDYRSEGMTRFVEKGKVGFVNRMGEVVISPRFGFVTPFNYGIANVCNDCKWKSDGEHELFESGTWTYINSKGAPIEPTRQKVSVKDQRMLLLPAPDATPEERQRDTATCLPYQFSYSPFEQSILAFFQKQPLISKAHFVNHFSDLDSSERQLYYEIVERPSAFFPYYHVKAFSRHGGYYSGAESYGDEPNFCVTPDGKTVYAFSDEKKIPFAQWLKRYVAEAKAYSKANPNAPYKF